MGRTVFLCALALVNLCAFAAMGIDKRRAKKGIWRISEKALFLWALFGGAWGALAGMRVFRHKTRKKAYSVGIPLLCALESVLLLWFAQIVI